MLACSSPKLFAAGRVLHRRMAPWHPPCALCSLIFSSLDPETNLSLEVWFASGLRLPLPTLHNWSAFLFQNHFSVQLSRCGALILSLSVLPESQFSSGFCFAVSFPLNPENDTGSCPQELSACLAFAWHASFNSSFSFDALCVFCVTHSLSVHTRRFPAFSR